MAITGKELAKIMGISEAAISMALNGKPGVGERRRKQIIDTAKELGYDFCRISSSEDELQSIAFLIYRKSGAIVNDSPFFSQLIEGISNTCKKLHCSIKIFYTYDHEDISKVISEIKNSDCRGMILLATEISEAGLRTFINSGFPMVVLDACFDTITADYVHINNIQGAFFATDYLIHRCKTQPGYLRSSYIISNFTERADGFYKAVRSHGMSTSKCIVHELTPSIDGAYADMIELIDNNENLASCYFADNDMLAIGVMQALTEKGYRIPEDISIIGFDDISYCRTTRPALTTVKVPKATLGRTAVERLLYMLENPDSDCMKIELSTQPEIRKSVI